MSMARKRLSLEATTVGACGTCAVRAVHEAHARGRLRELRALRALPRDAPASRMLQCQGRRLTFGRVRVCDHEAANGCKLGRDGRLWRWLGCGLWAVGGDGVGMGGRGPYAVGRGGYQSVMNNNRLEVWGTKGDRCAKA